MSNIGVPSTFFTTGLDPTTDRVIQKMKETHGDVDFTRARMIAQPWYSEVTLTAGQVKALFTTPITLVAAPGAGYGVFVESVLATMTYGTTTYACNASGFDVKYKSDASGQAVGIVLTQAFVQQTASYATHIRGSATAIVDTFANFANQPVVIQAHTSDPTTGDSPIKIYTFYRVLPVPLP